MKIGLNTMKITHEEALHICDKAQYNEASKWEYFKLKFHTFFCKTCAKHSKRNSELTGFCSQASLHALLDQEKEAMKEELKKQL